MDTFGGELWALMGIALTVALLHSVNPDHWLPFVMLGRARNWTHRRTLAIAGLAGTAHVGTSIVIGLIGLGLGAAVAERFATVVELVTGSLLVLFGLGFALLAYRRRGYHHHRFSLIERRFGIKGDELGMIGHGTGGEEHGHTLASSAGNVDCRARGSRAGYGLVAIVGLTPCVALLPVVFAATPLGVASVLSIMAVFFVGTVLTILTVTMLGLKGMQLVRLGFFERHGEIITGLVVAAVGVFVVSLGL